MGDICFFNSNTATVSLDYEEDITGATVWFTVKASLDDDDDASALIGPVVVISHDDAAAGLTHVDLTSTDTDIDAGEYFYDAQLVKTDGTLRTLRGACVVYGRVTTAKTVTP